MKTADVRPLRRVKHLKRGSCYEIIGKGELQAGAPIAEGECLVVYRCLGDNRIWIRPLSEFVDGRFEPATVEAEYDKTLAAIDRLPTSNGHLYCKECDRWMAPSECERAVCGLADG